MVGRTHDLIAFTALNALAVTQPISHVSLASAFAALGANLLGGLAPDADQPTSGIWERIPAGSIIGRLIHPLLGHHRMISHSLVGFSIAGFLANLLLAKIKTVLIVDMNPVWWSFMIGYLSHLVADSVTIEGVPWLFPIPIRLGFSPFKFLRLKTGGLIEKFLFFPGLLAINGYLFYIYYPTYIVILKGFIK